VLLPNTSWRKEKVNSQGSPPFPSSGKKKKKKKKKKAVPEIAPLQGLVEMSKG
jgi:hypothetical protein